MGQNIFSCTIRNNRVFPLLETHFKNMLRFTEKYHVFYQSVFNADDVLIDLYLRQKLKLSI